MQNIINTLKEHAESSDFDGIIQSCSEVSANITSLVNRKESVLQCIFDKVVSAALDEDSDEVNHFFSKFEKKYNNIISR